MKNAFETILPWNDSTLEECTLAKKIVAEKWNRIIQSPTLWLHNFVKSFFERSSNDDYIFQDECKVDFLSNNAWINGGLSNNFLSEIGFEICSRLDENDKNGVIYTPAILASSMVHMAAKEWASTSTNTTLNNSKGNHHDSMLLYATWYDPCVGGGVFLLSIMQFLYSVFHENANFDNIRGGDINPIYVEVSRLRCSCYLMKLLNLSFDDAYRFWENRILVADFLERNPSNPSIFAGVDNIPESDIIVGNPPYVNPRKISETLKKHLKNEFSELSGKQTDLYMFFILNAINYLKASGCCTFITPAQFQRNSYGKELRAFIKKSASVTAVFDFNELPIFKNVGVHTSVFSIKKLPQQDYFLSYSFDSLPRSKPLEYGYSMATQYPASNLCGDSWVISAPETTNIYESLLKDSIPLSQYAGRIYSGIKTGSKIAYFIQEEQLNDFSEDEIRQYIRPMILPRDITPWKVSPTQLYMIIIKKDEKIPEESSLFKHFSKFKNELCQRADAQKVWYSLRECTYYDMFPLVKIIYPDISTRCRFAMDKSGLMLTDGAYFIPVEDYYLLGILNSSVAEFYFRNYCANIGNAAKGGRFRLKKIYMENLPIKNRLSNEKLSQQIANLAYKATLEERFDSTTQDELNSLVMDLYNIPESLREQIRGCHAKK